MLDRMIDKVVARKDADLPFTALDLATEVAWTMREFGRNAVGEDGTIDENYWAHRFSKMPPMQLCQVLVDYLALQKPRVARASKVGFVEIVLTRPTLDPAALAAVKADARLKEFNV